LKPEWLWLKFGSLKKRGSFEMKVELSKDEIGTIKNALWLASEWEKSLIETHDHIEDSEVIRRCRVNVRRFRKLGKKLLK